MTPQRPTLIELNRQSLPHAVYGYDAADAVTSVEYPRLGVTTTIDVNARGAQLRTRTQKFTQLAPVIFEQRLAYDDLDQITKAWSTANGAVSSELYGYDQLGRLASTHPTDTRLNPAEEVFQYDLAGNRTYVFDDANGIAQTYAHAPTTNRLTRFIQSETGNPMYRDHTLAYQSDGALATRTRSDAQGAQMVQRNESFAYDAFGLIERYRVQRDVGGMQGSCAPDASSQPISEWRYRFGPLQEREQKRQYLSDVPAGGLAWTYTLLGADAKQLASYNGIQGAFCGQPPATVWLWPVEYNSYGPAHTRVITRPGGASEYVLHDHLGSARITLDNAARVIESQSYTAYGDHRTHDGEASRTSYIGRETDKESDLGFNGVRLYDPTYGRFLSVDPLWGKYLPLQSYQYAANNPVMMLDRGGDSIIVLQDWEGANPTGNHAFGHTAVLIGGDDVGWKLYSKNGGEYGVYGESINPQYGQDDRSKFTTLAEFKETAKEYDLNGRYDNAVMIPTTKEQDAAASKAAKSQVLSTYSIVGLSCADVASDALKAAGKDAGYKTTVVPFLETKVRTLPWIPNVRFHYIVNNNAAKPVENRVISPKRQNEEQNTESR
jgi:RHS repeat-associated protein